MYVWMQMYVYYAVSLKLYQKTDSKYPDKFYNQYCVSGWPNMFLKDH